VTPVRLIHIAPELPPTVGGVADYAVILSRRLVEVSDGTVEPVLIYAGHEPTEAIVAGIAADYVGKFFSLNRVGKIVLCLARRNLRTAYAGVGVTEQFEETKRRFASRIGGATRTLNERPKVVPDRPTAKDLSVSQRDALRHLNRLDVELYDYACKLFERGRN
jgi:hypothetical protein